MKNIMVWNDLVLNPSFPDRDDKECREFFSRSFGGCCSRYLGRKETNKWISNASNEQGISLGSRPSRIWTNDIHFRMHRVFDSKRYVSGFYIEETEKKEVLDYCNNTRVIIVHEDCLVEGKTISCFMNEIANTKVETVKMHLLAAVRKNAESLMVNYPGLSISSEYWLDDSAGGGDWECTVLFVSDLINYESDGKLFIEDERRFKNCFYDSYLDVLDYCIGLRNKWIKEV